MKEIKIKITEELRNYIQTLWYEIDMKKQIIEDILTNESLGQKVSNSLFKDYEKELLEKRIEFDFLMDEVKTNILGPLNGHEVKFNVNFKDCTLDTTIMCECGEKIYNDNLEYFKGVSTYVYKN